MDLSCVSQLRALSPKSMYSNMCLSSARPNPGALQAEKASLVARLAATQAESERALRRDQVQTYTLYPKP